MTSKQFFDKVKEFLSANKFVIYNENFGNGYFVFDMGDNSTVSFYVKQAKGWLFSFWFEFEEETDNISKVTFFTRHTDDLDKFKPTRSYFVHTINVKDSFNEYNLYYIVDLLKQIKQHPMLTYCIDSQNSYYGGYGFVRGFIAWEYTKSRLYYFKKRIKDWYNDDSVKCNLTYIKLKKIKKQLEKEKEYIKSVKIRDSNKDGLLCCPRFTIDITWNCAYDENKCHIWLFTVPFYRWNGKRKIKSGNCNIDWHYLDDKRSFSFFPDNEEFEMVYGWRYKLYKKFFKKK